MRHTKTKVIGPLASKTKIFLIVFTLHGMEDILVMCHVHYGYMSHDMLSPTKWHFDMCRLRQACAASF